MGWQGYLDKYQEKIVGEGCSCRDYKIKQYVTVVYGVKRLIDYDMSEKKVLEAYPMEDDCIIRINCGWCGKVLYCVSKHLLTCRGDLF